MNLEIRLENPIPKILECQISLSEGSGKYNQEIKLP
jgi:hypothetical protein